MRIRLREEDINIVVNVQDFLIQNAESFQYAIVKYDGRTEAVYFTEHDYKGKDWFLESPCGLYEEHRFSENKNIKEWCLSTADALLEPEANRIEYVEQYMLPLIVDNVLYDIFCPQVEPYLPKMVDDIKLVTERECLFYLFKNKK